MKCFLCVLVCVLSSLFAAPIPALPASTAPSLLTYGWIGANYKSGGMWVGTDADASGIGEGTLTLGPSAWSGDPASATGSGSATVTYGKIQLYSVAERSTASLRSDLDSYEFATYMYGRFTDTMLIDKPGLTGLPGQVTFDITLTGSDVTSGSGTRIMGFWVRTLDGSYGYADIGPATRFTTYTIDPIDFTYGQPFSFYIAVGARSTLRGVDPGVSIIDLSHTATLSGLDVYDDSINAVTNYTLTTASGASYPFMQVPEPATLLLCAGGLAFTLIRRRR
jgi:hypothetical protein